MNLSRTERYLYLAVIVLIIVVVVLFFERRDTVKYYKTISKKYEVAATVENENLKQQVTELTTKLDSTRVVLVRVDSVYKELLKITYITHENNRYGEEGDYMLYLPSDNDVDVFTKYTEGSGKGRHDGSGSAAENRDSK